MSVDRKRRFHLRFRRSGGFRWHEPRNNSGQLGLELDFSYGMALLMRDELDQLIKKYEDQIDELA